MDRQYQKAVLQSQLNDAHADLKLKHSGHRLGEVPPCPIIGDDPIPIQTYDKIDNKLDTTSIKEVKPNNDLLKKGIIGALVASGLAGGGVYLGSKLANQPNNQVNSVAPVDNKEGDWLGALRRKGDNLPPAGAAEHK